MALSQMNFKKAVSLTLAAIIGLGVSLAAPATRADENFEIEQISSSDLEFFSPLLPNWIVERINSDLRFLTRIQFKNGTSPLSQKFFGAAFSSGQDYVQFLKANIKRIEADGASVCSENTAACASYDGVIHLSIGQQEWQSRKGRMARLAVLIHEAVHIKTQVGHVYCPIGPIYENDFVAGTKSCDNEIDQSYGYSYVFLHNVESNCSTCTKSDLNYIRIAKATYRSMILGDTNELDE